MGDKKQRDQFNGLPMDKKASLVEAYSHFIFHTNTANGEYTINLFEIEGAIVEVFFNNNTKEIDQIWMPDYAGLDCYLKFIDITMLKCRT